MVDTVHHTFGHYDIIHPLEDEHQLTTYLVWDDSTGDYRALITLNGASQQVINRFLKTMPPTVEHPHLVPIHDYGTHEGVAYVVRSYMAGGTLHQWRRMRGAFRPDDTFRMLAPVAQALQHAHQQEVIHFGLCPQVILRDAGGDLHLADMGIALHTGELLEAILPYAAPEVFLRLPYTPTVDVYAFAAIMYELLTGRPPFWGTTYVQLMEAHLNRLPKVDEDLSKDLGGVLIRAMDKSPYLRHESIDALMTDLADAIYGEQQPDLYLPAPKGPRTDGSISTFRPMPTRHSGGGQTPGQLYADALIIEKQDPARAADLYRELIRISPQRAQGDVIERLFRIEQDLGERKLPGLMVEAREARSIGDWQNLEHITRLILSYDATYQEADQLYNLGVLLSAAEVHYATARTAADVGHWSAAITLLREIYAALPNYDDPDRLAALTRRNAAHVQLQASIEAHTAQILALTFTDQAAYLATGSTDKSVKLWALPDISLQSTIPDHNTWVCSTIFSPSGDILYAGTWEGLIKMWEVPSGAYNGTIAGLTSQVRAMAFARHDPSLLATASGYFLTLWHMPQGRRIAVVRESDRSPMTALAFSQREPLLVCGMQNGTMRVRDAAASDYGIVFEADLHSGPIYALTCSPDGRWIASASRDGTAKLTDIHTGEVHVTLAGHADTVHDVAFSPDGSLLATAGRDCQVMLWDVADGHHLMTLEGHHDEVRSVAFSTNGRMLVSGGSDGYLKQWGVV